MGAEAMSLRRVQTLWGIGIKVEGVGEVRGKEQRKGPKLRTFRSSVGWQVFEMPLHPTLRGRGNAGVGMDGFGGDEPSVESLLQPLQEMIAPALQVYRVFDFSLLQHLANDSSRASTLPATTADNGILRVVN
jgi:hypothetical protein